MHLDDLVILTHQRLPHQTLETDGALTVTTIELEKVAMFTQLGINPTTYDNKLMAEVG